VTFSDALALAPCSGHPILTRCALLNLAVLRLRRLVNVLDRPYGILALGFQNPTTIFLETEGVFYEALLVVVTC
jgi:hypothetical protein